MDALEFLEAVWPEQGIYCLVAQPGWRHLTFTSIAAAAKEAERLRNTKDVYFAVHTLKAHSVEDLSKGEDGRAWRTHANMAECQCFFFDLDVGQGSGKYATRQDALNGLDQFLFRTHLPSPMVVSSGGGVHVYWLLDQAIASPEWYEHAARLRELAKRQGLLADPARTTDVSSILRVAGTFNHKEGGLRPVDTVSAGDRSETAEFLAYLAELTEDFDAPTFAEPANRAYGEGDGNLAKPIWNGPVSTLDEVCDVCEHTREYVRASLSGEAIPEPIWYAMLGLTQHLDNGDDLVRSLGKPNRTVDEKLAKLAQWNTRTGGQPPSCAHLNSVCGGDACQRCPFAGLGKNPLTVTAEVRKSRPIEGWSDNAASEQDNQVGGSPLEPLAEPTWPYLRSQAGISHLSEDKEGKQKSELICPYDIFVYEVCSRTEREEAFSMWAYTLPIVGQKTLKIPTVMLQDLRQLHHLFLNEGLIVSMKKIPMIQEALLSSLSAAQKAKAANRQYDHLGWNDETFTEFIMPTTVYCTDGSTKPCTISAAAKSTSGFVRQAGTLQRQIELMEFYAEDRYLPHQFMVLCGLASPLFQASGEHGIVVHASGDTGGSKSTALDTAASLWGYPKDYVINGTKTGATVLHNQNKAHTLCNLPVCIDEITKMSPDDAQNLAFGVSHKGGRDIMLQNSTARASRGGYKSTFTLTSGNTSLHNLLSIDNRAGTAGNMRIFEMAFPVIPGSYAPGVAFLYELNRNYGWIGPEFLKEYLPKREMFDKAVVNLGSKIADTTKMRAAERFWGFTMAAAMTGGVVAVDKKWLPFNLNKLREWLLDEQLPAMRMEVRAEETATSPAAMLANFISDKAVQTIIMQPVTPGSDELWPQNDIRGPIVARHEVHKKVMHVRKDTFRKWCDDRHKNGLHMIRRLLQSGAIFGMDNKIALGRGTKYEAARSVCFSVDLTHASLAVEGVTPRVVAFKPAPEKEVQA